MGDVTLLVRAAELLGVDLAAAAPAAAEGLITIGTRAASVALAMSAM